jgi:hypothetical protein
VTNEKGEAVGEVVTVRQSTTQLPAHQNSLMAPRAIPYFCLSPGTAQRPKSSALSIRFECEEVSLQIEFTTLPPKKPQPLCESWNEKGIGE